MDLEKLRQTCLAFPGVTEDIKWEHDLVFSIGGRMFCVASMDPPFNCSFKVKDEDFEEMSNRPGFRPAPYMARAKWVNVMEPTRLGKKEWAEALKTSYTLVCAKLTAKQRRELGL